MLLKHIVSESMYEDEVSNFVSELKTLVKDPGLQTKAEQVVNKYYDRGYDLDDEDVELMYQDLTKVLPQELHKSALSLVHKYV